jgi:hypothetical protein
MLLLILQNDTDTLGGERSTVRAPRVVYGELAQPPFSTSLGVFVPNSSFLVPFCDHVSEVGVFVAVVIMANVFCMF